MSKVVAKDVIRISAYITEQEGYIKRSDSGPECTADKVLDALELHTYSDDDLNNVKGRVEGWLAYINDDAQTGEYFDSLRAEVCKPMIDEMKIGLIASSFATYDRYKSYKAVKDKEKMSDFLGEEGDSVTFTIAEYKLVKSGTSKYGSNKYFLYRIKDEIGNIIIWFADHDCKEEFSHCNKATATISKLNTYNEVKQTNVSKLKFL